MLLTRSDLTTKRSQNYTSSLEIASERGGNSKAPCFARRAASAGGRVGSNAKAVKSGPVKSGPVKSGFIFPILG